MDYIAIIAVGLGILAVCYFIVVALIGRLFIKSAEMFDEIDWLDD